jgi:type IV secretory pathway VirB3-like protein
MCTVANVHISRVIVIFIITQVCVVIVVLLLKGIGPIVHHVQKLVCGQAATQYLTMQIQHQINSVMTLFLCKLNIKFLEH